MFIVYFEQLDAGGYFTLRCFKHEYENLQSREVLEGLQINMKKLDKAFSFDSKTFGKLDS